MEKNKNNNNNKINRRDFFKLAGAGTLASATIIGKTKCERYKKRNAIIRV